MDVEFEDDDTYGGDQLIPGAAISNLRNSGAKDDASIVVNKVKTLSPSSLYTLNRIMKVKWWICFHKIATWYFLLL